MTAPTLKGLPDDFRSFYRLFRRACSASVLHRNTQTVSLRNLYRPTFRRAGLVYVHVNKSNSAKDKQMEEKQKAWLDIWNKRMDNSLSLLYNSAHTRGLPHQITKFLGYFIHTQRVRYRENKGKGLIWNPQLPPNSPQYKPPVVRLAKITRSEKQNKMKTFMEQALSPLREVVRMAEGRDEISFGNLKKYTRVKPRKPPPRLDSLLR